MEVKINREIRNYTESIFFGLTLRQFICSLCACGVAILCYFIFNKHLNKEIVSWICILGALPFAGLGFFKYNGMPLEQFVMNYVRSEILIPKELKFISHNFYYDSLEQYIDNKKREELKKNDKINVKHKKTRER